MVAPVRPPARRALTPAVVLAAAFATACAALSIAFVAAHGGLEVPTVGASSAPVAAATASPAITTQPSQATAQGSEPPASIAPTTVPTESLPSGSPPEPTPAPSADPLTALPGCPDHPGCFLYTVRRGDTLSTISDRWLIGLWILEALNPQVTDPGTIVVGQTLYLGRSPVVRLDPCPDRAGCYLYVVRPGDRLSTIAGRYGTSTTAILELNPEIANANQIYSGETIRVPGPA